MAQQLSGVSVVIFIAGGILTFILLFIFAKRQIMRFALRSRRGPHVPIGHDGKKVTIHICKFKRLSYSDTLGNCVIKSIKNCFVINLLDTVISVLN